MNGRRDLGIFKAAIGKYRLNEPRSGKSGGTVISYVR